MRNKGFTLIELMIVVAIAGILSAIAIPKFMDLYQKSQRRKGYSCNTVKTTMPAVSGVNVSNEVNPGTNYADITYGKITVDGSDYVWIENTAGGIALLHK